MQNRTGKYKFYGSKTNIFWSKLDENKPSKQLFDTIDFQWTLFNITPNWVNQFSATIALREDTWTYFKLENTETNEVTYWFCDGKNKALSNGIVYELGLDVWTSYNMNVFESFPNEFKLLVERTHLPVDEYLKHNTVGVIDNMLNVGHFGDTTKPYGDIYKIDTTARDKIIIGDETYQISSNSKNIINKLITKCYVFAAESKDAGLGMYEYMILPVIELRGDDSFYYGNSPTRYLGNTTRNLKFLQTKIPNRFLGIFNMPLLPNDVKVSKLLMFQKDDSNDIYNYYGMYLQQEGLDISSSLSLQHQVWLSYENLKITDKIKYNQVFNINDNNTIPNLNLYGFFNSNTTWYNNQIPPNNFKVALGKNAEGEIVSKLLGFPLGKKIVFSQGFISILNNKDVINYGGQLPSNKETFANYMNGIREQMNTGIKISQENAIISGLRNGINTTNGISNIFTGNVSNGVSQISGGIFGLATNILNHTNTKLRYEAQITDAKNSIPVNYNNSADSDIRLNGIIDNFAVLTGQQTNFNLCVIFKNFSSYGTFYNNNLAFLYGVKINNYIETSTIKEMLNKNPCIYLELSSSFTESVLIHYINKLYPKKDLSLKQVICDAWNVGHRIWKVDCDLTQQYTIDISQKTPTAINQSDENKDIIFMEK